MQAVGPTGWKSIGLALLAPLLLFALFCSVAGLSAPDSVLLVSDSAEVCLDGVFPDGGDPDHGETPAVTRADPFPVSAGSLIPATAAALPPRARTSYAQRARSPPASPA